jgi:antitoxin (DNA-binding transcriptional repressor) of toxin-antitoxin stability system
MTLHRAESEVGVRELHDRLSEYLERVEQGTDLVVTRRGKPVARLSRFEGERPLEALARRGLVRLPTRRKAVRRPGEGTGEAVSELISEQRR